MKRFNIRLDGVTPIMFNKMTDEELLRLHDKDRPKFVAPKEPRAAAAARVYMTHGDNPEPYVPVDMLMSCFIAAGTLIKLDGKRQMSTAKSTLLPGFINIETLYMPLRRPDTGEPTTWEVDMRQGRNPNGGEAVCIIRPRFDVWAIEFEMAIDSDQIGVPKIRELVDIAGRRFGLGDFRPQRKGVFGQFKVGCWEEILGIAEAAE